MMSDPASPDGSLPAVSTPAAPSSTLQGDAAGAKALIEGWMAQGPTSPYYRGLGEGEWSGDRIQAHYRDLLRAEEAGSAEALGPPAQNVDADLPLSAEHYNIAGADGARSMDAEDRDIVDAFLPVAFAAGLGQRKVVQAIGWALTIPGITVEQFKALAIAADWSDAAIATCLKWHAREAARRGGRR
jgi:hypothetical protein